MIATRTTKGIHPHDAVARRIAFARNLSYDELKNRHLNDYQGLLNRVTLDLRAAKSTQPTEEALAAYQGNNHALETLYFQFGRYLLISSSRPGTLPANLQGMWNSVMNPPWNADYHTNINVQMNYWPAEVANLSECHLPLIDYINSLRPRGRISAKNHYGARGWTTHPPFQIDGNFGATAGVTEMQLQSHMDILHLLPALPDAWKDGSIRGLCARGGFDVDIHWKDGKLTHVSILSKAGQPCNVQYGDLSTEFKTQKGSTTILDANLNVVHSGR